MRILVVEDELLLREGLVDLLEGADHEVVAVGDGLSAVERGDTIHAPMLKDEVARMLDEERNGLTQPPRRRSGPRTVASTRKLVPDEPSHARE